VPDAVFDHPQLAAVYDDLDPDRTDLEPYVALVGELGARSALDVGCGTGTFALMLASAGVEVVGVDPAVASVEVARGKPGADQVTWIVGDATALPPLQVDLATMTANVAQVFLADDDWLATLRGIHGSLRPGGHLVFETRDPARRAWEQWTREHTHKVVDIPDVGAVETWIDLVSADAGDTGGLVSFHATNVFHADGAVIGSDSTLRFRSRKELDTSLAETGFDVLEVRDAPDRPGREWVYLARSTG
jgi:SAM-dependent methyltransferase